MKNKKRQPRPVVNPLLGFLSLSDTHKIKISIHYASVLDNLRSGSGSINDLYELLKACEFLYVALGTPNMFNDAEVQMNGIHDVAVWLNSAIEQAQNNKSSGFIELDNENLSDVRDLIVAIESLVEMCNVIQMTRWSHRREESLKSKQLECLRGEELFSIYA